MRACRTIRCIFILLIELMPWINKQFVLISEAFSLFRRLLCSTNQNKKFKGCQKRHINKAKQRNGNIHEIHQVFCFAFEVSKNERIANTTHQPETLLTGDSCFFYFDFLLFWRSGQKYCDKFQSPVYPRWFVSIDNKQQKHTFEISKENRNRENICVILLKIEKL